MKMEPVDVSGILYSSRGLRFGGFRTEEFLEETSDLENVRPGARRAIVGEAHYLATWLHCFPEVAFLVGAITFSSLAYASAFFVLAFLLEIARFYAFGASRTLSRACWVWHIIRFPLYIAAAIWLWPTGRVLAIVVIAFIILQGLWLLASAVMMLPLRLLVSRLVYNWASHVHPQIHNMEGMAMAYVITRWRSSVSS
jgi:hypothetical protein